mmetsp:Transcript_51718/g.148263  ORF Transcript_51718/g.148263 Transcript_51718/m.148263 type:complete len:289 (-) Transcript_51718:410-1276(-)
MDAREEVNASARELHGASDHVPQVTHAADGTTHQPREEGLLLAVQARDPARNLEAQINALVRCDSVEEVEDNCSLLYHASGHRESFSLELLLVYTTSKLKSALHDRPTAGPVDLELDLPIVIERLHHSHPVRIQREIPILAAGTPQDDRKHFVTKSPDLAQPRLQHPQNPVIDTLSVRSCVHELPEHPGQLHSDALHALVAHAADHAEHRAPLLRSELGGLQLPMEVGVAVLQHEADVAEAERGHSVRDAAVLGAQRTTLAARHHDLLGAHGGELRTLEEASRRDHVR